MALAQFPCNECLVLDDVGIESHISAQHLAYFPLECAWCKEMNQMYLAATKKHMTQHMAIYHSGKNSRYSVSEDNAKEVELKKLAMECRRLRRNAAAPHIPSSDTKSALRRVLNVLGAATSTGNAAQNGSDQDDDDIIIIQDDDNRVTMSNDSLNCNLSEQPAEEIDPLISPFTSTGPAATVEIQQFITNPENNAPNGIVLIKPEPSNSFSTVPIGLRLQAALSSFVPIDIDANEVSEDYAKEIELKKLAKECRRLATENGNAAQNGSDHDDGDIIIIGDDDETATVPNESWGNNLSEQPAKAIESLSPSVTSTRPREITETGPIVGAPIANSKHKTPNAVILAKPEPSGNVSTVVEHRFQAQVPIDVEENEEQCNSIAKISRMPGIFCKKRSLSDDSTENSVRSPKNRLLLPQQSAGHALDASIHSDQFSICSSEYNADGEQNDESRTITKENETATVEENKMLRFARQTDNMNTNIENEALEEPKAKKRRSENKIANIAALDNGTIVEMFKYLNYCQLANNSLVSKRFEELIQSHRHKLALLYVDNITMKRRFDNSDPVTVKILNKELSNDEYNEWVVRNNYSNRISLKGQTAGNTPDYELSAYGGYKGPNQEATYEFFARVKELNVHEYWPLFEHFIRLITDPFVYIRYLGLTPQADVLKLLAATIDRSNRGRLKCEKLGFGFQRNVQTPFNWIKDHVRCVSFEQSIAVSNCSATRHKQLFEFFATGSRCTSEIVIDSHISQAVIIDFVLKFMDLRNSDENHIVRTIRGNVSNPSAESVMSIYEQFTVKKEKNQHGWITAHVSEFINVIIRKILQLTITRSYREPCRVMLEIMNL